MVAHNKTEHQLGSCGLNIHVTDLNTFCYIVGKRFRYGAMNTQTLMPKTIFIDVIDITWSRIVTIEPNPRVKIGPKFCAVQLIN